MNQVQATRARLIYVEDEPDWQQEVKDYIERVGRIRFAEFITGRSIKILDQVKMAADDPLVLIIDLRLEDEPPNYEGYHWILEKYEDFVRDHPNTEVFIISGQLNEGIIATLSRRGIPANHIFDKGSWNYRRSSFLRVLEERLAMVNKSGKTSGKIDAYILHEMKVLEEFARQGTSEGARSSAKDHRFPILVQTKKGSWDHNKIPDLKVLGHIESIYTCLGSRRSILALEKDPMVLKVEASRPGSGPEVHTSLPFVKANVIHRDFQETGDQCIIGIIDTGIDISHRAFLDKYGRDSRIMAIWDLSDSTGPAPAGMGFGTEYSAETINNFIKSGDIPFNLLYRDSSHGTHVASIAAGRPTAKFGGGVAPEAKIVVVIPDIDIVPGKPNSIGYSNSHLLALQYMRGIAEREGLPIVINVSQGMNAGAHDGTSLLEKGFDQISDNGQAPGIVVVKSAGNERGQGGHAHVKMFSNSMDTLEWRTPEFVTFHRHFRDDIELWFKASDRYQFRLTDPRGETTEWVNWSNLLAQGVLGSGNSYRISYTRFDTDNGDSRLLVTVVAGSGRHIAEGIWKLEIESGKVHTGGDIHAWIERNPGQRSIFINHVDDSITISIPGTARYVISVGAVYSQKPFRLAQFSSHGPTRDKRAKPDLSAPGVNITAAYHGSEQDVVAMDGTSMAAPHVAGAIALLFSYAHKKCRQAPHWHQYNSAQIQEAITQLTQDYNGHWHPGLGYGVLDIERFLREFGMQCR